MDIILGARGSRLSKEQVAEVWAEISAFHPHLRAHPVWTTTGGDNDRTTPLWKIAKTDFFTQEIDELLVQKKIRLAIHSAKDLPSPLPDELSVIALTKGVDPRDSLVMREKATVETLPKNAKVGTSSKRRESALKKLRADLQAVDIRGTIDERLEQLHTGAVDAVIVAEAALIRLKLTFLNRLVLDCATEPLQGKLAVVARTDDHQMASLFTAIDTRKRVAVVGPSIPQSLRNDPTIAVIHSSLIDLKPIPVSSEQLQPIMTSSGVIVTSKHAAKFLYEALGAAGLFLSPFRFFCVGEETAATTRKLFSDCEILTARDATQEGLVELILSVYPNGLKNWEFALAKSSRADSEKTSPLLSIGAVFADSDLELLAKAKTNSSICLGIHPQQLFWPRSTHARKHLPEALLKAGILLKELPLYTPLSSSTPCSLEGIDTVFFTCPSSVDAFFDMVSKSTWESLSLQAIGPVTQARLTKRLFENPARV